MNTLELENLLRLAPRPTPPAGLKDQLIAQLRLPADRAVPQSPVTTLAPAGWLRRWWPVLAPAAVSLACAAVLTVQQMEIHGLKQANRDLSRDSAPKAGAVSAPTEQTNDAASTTEAAARTQQEIARLKGLASQLAAEIAQLEQMRAENAKLRTQLEAPPAGFLTPEDTEALAKAKERAERIACINNMKYLGLAARAWANDNGDMTPPDILSLTTKMASPKNSPKILVCPSDTGRQAAKDWASYTSANCSYEYLAPSAPETDPNRVMFRCPIHGHVGLVDGSVQAIAKNHPELLVQRDGKLYLAEPTQPAQGAPAPPSGNRPPGGSNP
jgi:hypothetical protein